MCDNYIEVRDSTDLNLSGLARGPWRELIEANKYTNIYIIGFVCIYIHIHIQNPIHIYKIVNLWYRCEKSGSRSWQADSLI